MKIPKNLPQFEKFPALFAASGEYEARFYLAKNGSLELLKTIKMPPREEAREKQAFVGIKGGRYGLAAVSHHGAYIEDLKRKFAKQFHLAIHDFNALYKLDEICIFAPRYVVDRVMKKLDQPEQKKVRMKFYGQLSKSNPITMIEKYRQAVNESISRKKPLSREQKKILKIRS